MKTIKIGFLMGFMLLSLSAAAQQKFNMYLYQGSPSEVSSDVKDTAKVTVFLPADTKATGKAVVICPGGGYEWLAIDNEGFDWAPFFNEMGIAAIVLKYRMPHGNPAVPVSDAEEAMKLVRRHAASWHIDSHQVGVMGSSAGGHLASTIATHSKGDAKPDFQILFYPVITMMQGLTHQGSHDNLLGKDAHSKDEKFYSNDMQVTYATPRAFITLASDDDLVSPMNGVNYYRELYRHDVRVSLYVYPSGGHGFGSHTNFRYHNAMQHELRAWLRSF